MEALAWAVKSGKALYAGISNYDVEHAKQATEILKELKCPFVLNQNSYSIMNRRIEKNGLKQFAAENGYGLIAFKPLEQGLLTDKYLNGIPDDCRIRRDGRFLKESVLTQERLSQIQALNEIAERRGQTLAQLSLIHI